MIVIISDLQFVDETAGKHSAPVDASHILFDDVIIKNKTRHYDQLLGIDIPGIL